LPEALGSHFEARAMPGIVADSESPALPAVAPEVAFIFTRISAAKLAANNRPNPSFQLFGG